MIKVLRCIVVTPEAQVVDAEAMDMVLPAHDGLLGVLPGHAGMLCKLGSGLVRYQDSQNQTKRLYIEGGFGHIHQNEVTLLTRQAISSEQITPAEAQEQLHKADSLPKSTIEEVQARGEAIQRAKHLIVLAG
jgi:F-type H+-transporting ATPase subunit epsilon